MFKWIDDFLKPYQISTSDSALFHKIVNLEEKYIVMEKLSQQPLSKLFLNHPSILNDQELLSNIVNQINGVEFNWKDNGNKSAGVIAQQLEKILPHLVDENEGKKSVNYSGLIAYLIQSNKELAQRIEKLENKYGDR